MSEELSEEDAAQEALEQAIPEPPEPIERPAIVGQPWAAVFSTTNEDEPTFE